MAYPAGGVTGRPEDESTLVSRAQHGDDHAFASLVRRHAPIAHRAAYVITRNASDADDALQEGTVKAWRNLHRFDPERAFRPWFVTIVANTARNRARAWKRREALALRVAPDTPPSDPSESAISSIEAQDLLRHVDGLPQKYRAAVALRHLVGLSEGETADALGIRPGTVKSRVSRGLQRLRDTMGGEGS